MSDARDEILAEAYERCAVICETIGHVYVRAERLNGERWCGYCHLIMAMAPVRSIDKAA